MSSNLNMDRSVLCSEYHVYFVRGWNANILSISRTKESEDTILGAVQNIFGVDNDHFHVIDNNPKSDNEVKEEIKKCVIRTYVNCGCDKITTVILSHSLGTRFTYYALKELYDLRIVSDQVYSRTAIISLGGMDLIPKKFAKIALNFIFQNDTVVNRYIDKKDKLSNIYETITIGPFKRKNENEYKCGCCNYTFNQLVPESYTTGGMIKSIAPYAFGFGALVAAPISTPVAAAVGVAALFTGGVIKSTLKCEAHYMIDYLLCNTWKDQINDRLFHRSDK